MIPAAAVAEAHSRLHRALEPLTDEQVRAASPLPGWTRGHVLAHVTDAGRALADLVENALRGVLIPLYDPKTHDRDAIIEATAGRTAEAHRRDLLRHSVRLEDAWARVTDWDQHVDYRDGKLSSTVFARWREVWIHAVDLDVGIGVTDWPGDFCHHAVDFLQDRLPAGLAIQAGEHRWGSGRTEVTGSVRALAAWLSGRTTGAGLAGDLPELGPWPVTGGRRPPRPARPAP
ncbi:maleylpyruvate isomerase family mycothiol-dependent enzyme [Amycolatopsis sp. OK19-0408]|uniref:Maleylpyruvate isomerase family mycothiol-dependent enzyme n=1 Tax=Amycolatopsis iheyensis TaxID=2945988 RepID=A0A9X2SMG7_9PSEU|nr:maleylpyruvate isomerase family mycothiol-dependent enzyme [Amycolatopsis iheyensis]MCR6485921.1 maleylpyruvate isomerase family mycothiol-dependent enzyme [Amycolatopsis iheyensis]